MKIILSQAEAEKFCKVGFERDGYEDVTVNIEVPNRAADSEAAAVNRPAFKLDDSFPLTYRQIANLCGKELNNKILAICVVRTIFRAADDYVGLAEAKNFVEACCERAKQDEVPY